MATTPRRNIQTKSNKALINLDMPANEENKRGVFPTIHENKQLKNTQSERNSMKTVGVLHYGRGTPNEQRPVNNNVPSTQRNKLKHQDISQRKSNTNQAPQSMGASPQNSPRRHVTETPYGPDKKDNSPRRHGKESPFGTDKREYNSPRRRVNETALSQAERKDQNERKYPPKGDRGKISHNDGKYPKVPPNGNNTNLITNDTTGNEIKTTPQEQLSSPKEGLSVNTKIDVLSKSKHLIYKETVWTRKRVDKLADTGFGNQEIVDRIKRIKEDKRWDLIMKHIHQEPQSVHSVWSFIAINYPDLFEVLNSEYVRIIRKTFKPQVSNLQTTPVNANKMVDLLMVQAEQFDERFFEVKTSLAQNEKILEEAKKVIKEARGAIFNWSGRELPESDQTTTNVEDENTENILTMSQDLLDTFLVSSAEKEDELTSAYDQNGDLKKRVSRLTKALKEKDRQLKDSRTSLSIDKLSEKSDGM